MLNKSYRNDGIDLFRGLSIIFVILLHINIRIPFNESPLGQILPESIYKIFFKSGYYGVIIFFVISGFLITSTSIRRWGNLSDIQLSRFYQMRFARIMPCLFVFLIISSLLHLINIKGFIINTTTLQQAVFSALTFQINWLEAKTGYLAGAWDVLWSLSVEEMFYLFFPLLCLLVRKEIILYLILIFFVFIGPFERCAFTDNDIWSDHSYLSCMDGIAIGCLAALYVSKYPPKKSAFIFFTLLGALLFTFIFIFRSQVFHLGLTKIGLNVTLLEMSTALILVSMHTWFFQQKHHGSIFTAIFRWFGRNSYEIYLTHMFVVLAMSYIFIQYEMRAQFIPFLYLTILILTGIVGQLLAIYFSEPLNRLLRFKSENIIELQYSKEN